MKIIILAGGSGTRLWPLSRERYPKQFIKLNGSSKSLFQETFERSLELAEANDIYVVTNQMYKFLVMGEVEELKVDYPECNILIEPEPKNTLPAIYAGVKKIKETGDDTIVVFPSDHKIIKSKYFNDIIKDSEELVKKSILTFGIKPDHPNTGYGYISPGEPRSKGYWVKEFKEKPDFETAIEYIEKNYYWNAGIFMFDSNIFTEELKTYALDIYKAFEDSADINESFSKIEKGISIDYGILEKSNIISVIEVDIGWNDLGSFDSFYDVFEKDDSLNIATKDSIFIDSSNNIVHSESGKLVASVGIEDIIIIDNRDALLICKKDQSQKVKNVVEYLKSENDLRSEYHVQDYRPWGNYKILEEEKGSFKIKRIMVNPGRKLSYQLHYHRSEHWIVVKGMAKVTIDDEVLLIRAGESIFMKAGQKHRLENPGKVSLEIIEVQMGEYLEEDDIIRLEDEFGRL